MNAMLLSIMRSGLFNNLDDSFIVDLLQHVEQKSVLTGEWVVREGEKADAFFIVLSGSLEVLTHTDAQNDVLLGMLGEGAYFGEQALLPESQGIRMASVRGKAPRTTLACLNAHLLKEMLSKDSSLGRSLKELGEQYQSNRMVRRTQLVQALLSDVRFRSEELHLENGTVLFRQGQPRATFYIVLNGNVELLDESEGLPVRLASLGPGLLVGKQSTEHYTATAIADGKTSLLSFPSDALAQVSTYSPEIQGHLTKIRQVWELPKQGFITQYMTSVDGASRLTQVYNLKDQRTLLATHSIDGEAVRLEHVGRQPRRTIATPSGELTVALDEKGGVAQLVAQKHGPEFGILFEKAIQGIPLKHEEEQTLTQTGQLPLAEEGFLCTCLRVRRSTVLRAIEEGHDFSEIQRNTGAGLSCGSCLPLLQELSQGKSFFQVAIDKIESPTEMLRRVFLKPLHRENLPTAKPGQHIVLKVSIQGRTVTRSYTLSGPSGGPWEITVKRLKNGVFSTWLFEEAKVGTQLEASRPQGNFIWEGGPSPVLCYVAGVGMTPALAFARTLIAEGWPHRLVIDWSTQSPKDIKALSGLEQMAPSNLTLCTRFTAQAPRLRAKDLKGWKQRFPTARYFLCGPIDFMQDVQGWLRELGIPSGRIHREHFNPTA